MRFVHTAFVSGALLTFALPVLAATGDAPAPNAQAARAAAIAAVCAKVTCRETAHEISLAMTETTAYRYKNELFPYIDEDGAVILYPGDTITVTLDKQGEALGKPRLLRVEDAEGAVGLPAVRAGSAGTISFSLIQDKDGIGMTLEATNTIDMLVKYEAQISLPTAQGIRSGRTSICPLPPPQKPAATFSGREHWPQPIAMMVLTGFRALPAGSPMTCN